METANLRSKIWDGDNNNNRRRRIGGDIFPVARLSRNDTQTDGRSDGRTWGQRRLRMCVAEQPASRLTRGRSNLSRWPTSGRHHSIVCKHGHLFHLSCCQPSINQTDGRCCCRLAIDSRRDIDCAIFGHTNSGGGGKGGELGRRRHLITYCWLSLAARLLGSQPAARSPAIEGRLAERRRPSSAAGAQSHS